MNRIVKQSIVLTCMSSLVFALSFFASYRYFANQIYSSSLIQIGLYAETLQSKLFELRPLDRLIATHPDMLLALKNPSDQEIIDNTNLTLLINRNISGASEIYLLDANGLTIAASNATLDGSFVGNNYGFRPYFTQAIEMRAISVGRLLANIFI